MDGKLGVPESIISMEVNSQTSFVFHGDPQWVVGQKRLVEVEASGLQRCLCLCSISVALLATKTSWTEYLQVLFRPRQLCLGALAPVKLWYAESNRHRGWP